jgi:hypothetical protein
LLCHFCLTFAENNINISRRFVINELSTDRPPAESSSQEDRGQVGPDTQFEDWSCTLHGKTAMHELRGASAEMPGRGRAGR